MSVLDTVNLLNHHPIIKISNSIISWSYKSLDSRGNHGTNYDVTLVLQL